MVILPNSQKAKGGTMKNSFLLFATILGYMAYRQIWADKKH